MHDVGIGLEPVVVDDRVDLLVQGPEQPVHRDLDAIEIGLGAHAHAGIVHEYGVGGRIVAQPILDAQIKQPVAQAEKRCRKKCGLHVAHLPHDRGKGKPLEDIPLHVDTRRDLHEFQAFCSQAKDAALGHVEHVAATWPPRRR